MDGRALDLPTVGRVAAPGFRVILGVDLDDVAVFVLSAAGGGHQISALETDLVARIHPLILGNGCFQEVLRLDPQLAAEGDGVGALLGMNRIVLHLKGFRLTGGIIGYDQLDRVQHRHGALRCLVQILPETVLQKAVFDGGGSLCYADALTEIANGPGGVAPAAQSAEGRHTGIVPAGDPACLHQKTQLALGHDRVVDAQTGKFDLAGLVVGNGDVAHHPVVEGAVGLKFQGAEAVGDALQGVLDGMGEVVHGIDAPFGALAVMLNVADAVDDRVAQVEIAACQVDLCPEGSGALGEFTLAHPLEQVQIFLDGAVTVGGDGGLADVAAVFPELVRRQVADVGQTLFDQLHGVFVVFFKIIGAVEEAVAPVKAQPVDVVLDRLDVLRVLLGRVGVIHAQIAQAVEFFRGAEVDAQGLAVADVEIAVRLRREAGMDGHALILPALSDVFFNEGLDKIIDLGSFVFHIFHPLGNVDHNYITFSPNWQRAIRTIYQKTPAE